MRRKEPTIRTCPCGDGYYIIIYPTYSRSLGDRWDMQCTVCARKYDLYAYQYQHNGVSKSRRGWIPRQVMKDLVAQSEKVERTKNKLSVYAQRKFSKKWHSHFAGKEKVAVWRELTDNGKRYPSLRIFYKHVHHSSIEEQLNRYFQCDQLPTIVRILGLESTAFMTRLAEIELLECELRKQQTYARRQMFE